MSHKATVWLSEIEPDRLSHGAFRVLFHLCDCHNPSSGCFPTQAYLVKRSGLGRSGVNLVLGKLECEGLISRHQSVDPKTRKQRPTRYHLAFEKGFKPTGKACAVTPEPCPMSGLGKRPKPCPDSGPGTVSTNEGEPCPLNGQSRVHCGGHKPVREPVIKQRGRAPLSKNPLVIQSADKAVGRFRDGDLRAFESEQPWVISHIIAADLLTPEERQRSGIS